MTVASGESAYEKREFGRCSLLLPTPAQIRPMDDRGHAARTTRNLLPLGDRPARRSFVASLRERCDCAGGPGRTTMAL